MTFLKKLLDMLPLNGDKTKIGALLSIIAGLQYFFPSLSVLQLITLVLDNLMVVGPAVLTAGVTHKVLKKAE